MDNINTDFLISRMEDFYEVWSDGYTGDPRTVAAKLADYNTGSRQTAKKTMKTPTLLCERTRKVYAISEAQKIEALGLKCRIIHVGKTQLDAIDGSTISNALTANGKWSLDSVFTDRDAKLVVHVPDDGAPQSVGLDIETDEGFCLYLACLRDLVRRDKILDLGTLAS